MAAKKITITITVEVPEGGTVTVQDASISHEHDRAAPDDGMPFAEANVRLRPFLMRFEDGLRAHDIRIERPDAERQDYRNVFPPPGYGSSRLGSVNITSGRYELPRVPDLAAEEPLAELYSNKGEPAGTKIYLTSDEAVDAAVRLSVRALEAR